MKWLCQLRLFGLLSIPSVALAATLRGRSDVFSWDYHDDGVSWPGTCLATSDQSPVNVSTTFAAAADDHDHFFFNYPLHEAPVKMVNDGRFLYTVFNNSDNKMGGVAMGLSYPHHLTEEWHIYKMLIHTPSEHTFGGEKVPLELQLFHRKEGAELKDGEPAAEDTAIVAVGFQESADEASPFLKSLIDGGLPDQRGGTSIVNRNAPSALKFSELFKPVFGAQGEEAGFWDYTGSLSQPPCSGGVRWFLRQQPANAKLKTLRYFTEVVKKSSGGVPGNARDLQPIGDRPVFPRFANNGVHMTVFDPEEPAAFTEALDRAKTHQKAFKDGLKTDDGGADAAIAAGADADVAVAASNDYQSCVDSLGVVTSELETAKATKASSCNIAEGYQKTMEDITGGPARLEAAAKGASAKKSCDDQSKVVQAKQGQIDSLDEQCNNIKSEVEKKAETAVATEDVAAPDPAKAEAVTT